MRTEEWQDNAAHCVQCENECDDGGCYASTKVVMAVAVAAQKQRDAVIEYGFPP